MEDIDTGDRQVWDDDALIKDWDAAVHEYQKYFSIEAQGLRLEDALTAEELAEVEEEFGDLIEEEGEIEAGEDDPDDCSENSTDMMISEADQDEDMDQDPTPPEESTVSGRQEQSGTAETIVQPHGVAASAAMPEAILGTVQDDNLKNVMMSWYYAGYYSGLYEGQQKADASGTQGTK